jgi:hypothetical protein
MSKRRVEYEPMLVSYVDIYSGPRISDQAIS